MFEVPDRLKKVVKDNKEFHESIEGMNTQVLNPFFGDTSNVIIGVKPEATDRQIELILKMHPNAEIIKDEL